MIWVNDNRWSLYIRLANNKYTLYKWATKISFKFELFCWLNILKRKDLKHPWIYIVFKNLNTSNKHCTEHNQGLLHLANDEKTRAWPEIGTYCHIHPHPQFLVLSYVLAQCAHSDHSIDYVFISDKICLGRIIQASQRFINFRH